MSEINTLVDIKKCLFHLMVHHPFFGRLAGEMEWVETQKIPTLATDFSSIYYNKDFFDGLTHKEKMFVISHEILHCVFEHGSRLHGRNMDYWNMATDYAINHELVVSKIGDMLLDKKGDPACLYDKKYAGKTSEEIYEILMIEQPPVEMTLDVHNFPQDGDGQDGSDDDQNKSSGDGDDKQDAKGQSNKAKQTQEQRERDFKQKVIESYNFAKMFGGKAGEVPGSIAKIVEELVDPLLDWRTLLSRSVQTCFKSDRSWSTVNRRKIDKRTLLPGRMEDYSVDICIAIDTSGSISDNMINDFCSEIAGILTVYKNFKLTMWCFDTQVYEPQRFEFHEVSQLMEPGTFKIVGRGGTTTNSNFEWMKKNNIKPKQLIIFTDYDGIGSARGDWGPVCDPNYCPTTWIINEERSESLAPPFGDFAKYKPRNK